MLLTEAKDLEARGYSSKDYASFLDESFEERMLPFPLLNASRRPHHGS